jgi:hypothetical protein
MVLSSDVQELTDAYISSQKGKISGANTSDTIVNDTVKTFNNTFANVFEMTGSAAKDYQAAVFYDTRTADFKKLQDAVATRTNGVSEELDNDINNARRQSQMNEWSAAA